MDRTMRILNEAKARLKEVEEGIAELTENFKETMKKKEELKEKCDLCTARLERAEKVSMCVCVHTYVHEISKQRDSQSNTINTLQLTQGSFQVGLEPATCWVLGRCSTN